MRISRGELSRRERQLRHAAEYAAKYPALARRRSSGQPLRNVAPDFSLVVLGHDQNGMPISIDERVRCEHLWAIGSTGSGKTTLFKHLALQDFCRGRGGVVIDPHGSHPGSLHNELIVALEAAGFFETGRVHIIDPNIRSHVVPITRGAAQQDLSPAHHH